MNIRIILLAIVLVCIITAFGATGCSTIHGTREENKALILNKEFTEPNHDEKPEASIIYLSLEDAIDQSNCVVRARLNSFNQGKTHIEYDFTLIETIIGDMIPHFLVDEGYADYSVENSDITYSTYDTAYQVGKEYILVLYKITSVYSNRDKYMIIGDIFFELDEAGNIAQYERYHQKEESPYKTAEEFSNYARSVTDNSKERLVYGIPFTRSTKISDIVDISQYIVKAVVSEIKFENPDSNRDTYICKVTESLWGSTRDEIYVVVFKDTVSIGKEYLFLLNKDTEDSLIYALSSANSVVDLDKDKGTIEEIAALITKQ